MSDTPRMNLALRKAQEDCTESYLLTEGLKLERELNEANKTISLQHELMTTAEKRGVDKAKEELNEANHRIKRLEEAGDKMEAWLRDERLDAVQHTVSKWRKAKEDKP